MMLMSVKLLSDQLQALIRRVKISGYRSRVVIALAFLFGWRERCIETLYVTSLQIYLQNPINSTA
jgi:hypothetical protein